MAKSTQNLRSRYEERERKHLDPRATFSSDSRFTQRAHSPYEPDYVRTEFHRDYTRIIHSRAFRRMRHKTQVFIDPKNDHLCTRLEHSLHVASVAQTIARALGLNEDLVRAISVGHDLGHAPFGHIGEKSLRAVAENEKCGLTFFHELHSLRVIDDLETSPSYPNHNGLNLTFAVRDGIVCHYGEGIQEDGSTSNKFEKQLQPDCNKKPDDLPNTVRGVSLPATLEGCVVRWADKVAYLGRDLEDARTVGLISDGDIPEKVKRVLGTYNREIIANLVRELTESWIGEEQLSVSDEMLDALNGLYSFNMDQIYKSEKATKDREKIDTAMKQVFERLLDCWVKAKRNPEKLASDKKGPRVLRVFGEFLRDDIRKPDKHKDAQLVIDYIAGMTDSFFRESYIELFVPQKTI